MPNNFGLLKNVRTASWECLLNYSECGSLPVSITDIASKTGIKIIRNSSVNIIPPDKASAAFFTDKQWYIVYNDEFTRQESRFRIARELGHILLGHKQSVVFGSSTAELIRFLELEADVFALGILAPEYVLYRINVHKAAEIAELCDISIEYARLRENSLKKRYRRSKINVPEYEQQVYIKFRDFTEDYLSQNNSS
ncbi:MAG: ImmA/IrrE family metallo-endopeptidase [Oscillospiraceae bacterium]|nr:ImmA/IrrE family metallo-endopeptidase [Oscillospiraceae bacterium]